MGSALLRRLPARALGAEIAAQLAAFKQAFGQPPAFIDGHQHVQLLPQVRDLVVRAAQTEARGCWVRQCGNIAPFWRRPGDPKALVLNGLSRELRRRAAACSVPVNAGFAGTYTFRAGADFAAHLPRFLRALPDGGLLMCHPGRVDAELARIDRLLQLREQEYRYLAGEAFARELWAQEVSLSMSPFERK